MQALPDVLRALGPRPTRALFLAFDASPPFIDSDVWGALVSSELSDLTIVVDSLSLHAASIDAGSTRRAGVYYRIAGVRPRGGGLFHPKLACLVHDEGVHVLIGSANLTWSGWCRNVEIIDVISFGPSRTGPQESALALAEFLDELPGAVEGLVPDDVRSLQRVSEALVSAAEHAPTGERDACRVLHNLREPLLDQVRRHVPPSAVTDVTAVSPFHDPVNSAAARIAKEYRGARLRVVKDGLRVDDFDGPSFARLPGKPELRQTVWPEAPRPLHAKTFCFEGPRDCWLVAGSANLTTPAWLRAADDGGNVELVTLRHAARTRGAKRPTIASAVLLEDLPTEVVPEPETMRFRVPASDLPEPARTLHLYEAVERDWRLMLGWTVPGGTRTSEDVTLTLRSQDRAVQGAFRARREGDAWRLDVDLTRRDWCEVLDDEIAVVVRLGQAVDGEELVGTAWLRRVGLLGQRPEILDLRHRLRALSAGSSNRPEDLLNGIAALIEAAEREPDAFDLRGEKSDDAGAGAREGTPGAGSALRPMLRPLVMPHTPQAGRITRRTSGGGGGAAWDDPEVDEQEPGDEEETDRDVRLERVQALAEHFGKLVRVARGYTQLTLEEAQDSDGDRHLVVTSGILLSGLAAAGLALRQDWLGADAADADERFTVALDQIRAARRDLWSLAFSLNGWETGTCAGWFPRIRTDARWAVVAPASFGQPAAVARILADLAEQSARTGMQTIPPDAAYVLRMLGLPELPPSGELADRVEQLLRDQQVLQPGDSVEPLLAVLAPAGVCDLPGWSRLSEWLPIADMLDGGVPPSDALAALPDELRKPLSAVLRRADARSRLARVRFDEGGAVCLACDTSLTLQLALRLRSARRVVEHCPHCSRPLLPIDLSAPIVRAVLEADPERTSRRESQP